MPKMTVITRAEVEKQAKRLAKERAVTIVMMAYISKKYLNIYID